MTTTPRLPVQRSKRGISRLRLGSARLVYDELRAVGAREGVGRGAANEIGAALGLSNAAVEKHVIRALEWLHQEISKHDEGRTPLGKLSSSGRPRE